MFIRKSAFSLLVLLGTAGAAHAGVVFSIDLPAASLGSAAVKADTLHLGDYARITTTNGGTQFTDVGFLPVQSLSLGGKAAVQAGLNAAGGTGWGVYIRYAGAGTQTLVGGVPAVATYTALNYQIVAYKGLATFGFDASGQAVIGGTVKQQTTLGQGSLISGGLGFVPMPAGPSIEGGMTGTLVPSAGQLTTDADDVFALTINHPAGSYAFTSPTTLEIDASDGATAMLLPGSGSASSGDDPPDPDPVPEPGSALLLAAGLGAFAARRPARRPRAGANRPSRVQEALTAP